MKTYLSLICAAIILLCGCQREELSTPGKDEVALPQERIWNIKTPVRTRAVADNRKTWETGSTIRIKFLNAESYPDLTTKVRQYAALWLKYANLHFEYVEVQDSADVKIGFNLDESRGISWCTTGTDCRQIDQQTPSLNFAYLEYEDEAGIKAEVLRGFGYVLGLGFEHQNPAAPLEFLPTAQSWIAATYGLSEEDAAGILEQFTTDHSNYTEFDKNSIMTLTIPRNILTPATRMYATNPNMELSHQDTTFIHELYPSTGNDLDTLVIMTVQRDTISFNMCGFQYAEINWGDGNTTIVEDTVTIAIRDTSNHYGGLKREFMSVDVSHIYTNNEPEHHINILGKNSLITFSALGCKITYLDISRNEYLTLLDLLDNSLTSIDFSKSKNLVYTCLNFNPINHLDIDSLTSLGMIIANDLGFTTINTDNNKNLRWLEVSGKNLQTLDVSKNLYLETLRFPYSQVQSIDVSHNIHLSELMCYNSKLESLDVSNNPELSYIMCEHTPLLQDTCSLKNFVNSLPLKINTQPHILIINNPAVEELIHPICSSKGWTIQ